ncbi:hypothetical protein TcWFU_006071 [Taenia crassiceps]|uniref:Uncharacterized protein n=1 Tax=Taenia crassiceps TaxID=6207 RepID=A0ABR4Q5J3_9CEST
MSAGPSGLRAKVYPGLTDNFVLDPHQESLWALKYLWTLTHIDQNPNYRFRSSCQACNPMAQSPSEIAGLVPSAKWEEEACEVTKSAFPNRFQGLEKNISTTWQPVVRFICPVASAHHSSHSPTAMSDITSKEATRIAAQIRSTLAVSLLLHSERLNRTCFVGAAKQRLVAAAAAAAARAVTVVVVVGGVVVVVVVVVVGGGDVVVNGVAGSRLCTSAFLSHNYALACILKGMWGEQKSREAKRREEERKQVIASALHQGHQAGVRRSVCVVVWWEECGDYPTPITRSWLVSIKSVALLPSPLIGGGGGGVHLTEVLSM